MRSDFTMTLTGEAPLGDYLLFKITDSTEKKQGRITLTAIAVLAKGAALTHEQAFEANRTAIREASSRSSATRRLTKLFSSIARTFEGMSYSD